MKSQATRTITSRQIAAPRLNQLGNSVVRGSELFNSSEALHTFAAWRQQRQEAITSACARGEKKFRAFSGEYVFFYLYTMFDSSSPALFGLILFSSSRSAPVGAGQSGEIDF